MNAQSLMFWSVERLLQGKSLDPVRVFVLAVVLAVRGGIRCGKARALGVKVGC